MGAQILGDCVLTESGSAGHRTGRLFCWRVLAYVGTAAELGGFMRGLALAPHQTAKSRGERAEIYAMGDLMLVN